VESGTSHLYLIRCLLKVDFFARIISIYELHKKQNNKVVKVATVL
jgi:hypothetical protein